MSKDNVLTVVNYIIVINDKGSNQALTYTMRLHDYPHFLFYYLLQLLFK